jgi:hypothetical protein
MPVPRKRSLFPVQPARLLFLAACVALMFSCTDRGQPPVSAENSPYNDATVYRIATGDCVITWTVYTTDLNRGVIKHFSRCSLPLAGQVPLLERIVKTVLEEDKSAKDLRTLFWGGLVPEQGGSSLEMASRLALAAHRSADWDTRTGRPKNGDLNGFVKDLANSEPISPEIQALFKGVGRTVAVASVEKVRVLKAKELPFFPELKTRGVQEWERLPFDGMVWFSVKDGHGKR